MFFGAHLLLTSVRFHTQIPDSSGPLPGQLPDSASTSAPANAFSGWLQAYPLAETGLWVVGAVFLAWLADAVAKRFLLRAISRLVAKTRFTWDDAIAERKVFERLAHVAPALVLYYGAPLVPGLPDPISQIVQRASMAVLVLVIVLAADGLLSAMNDVYQDRPDAKSRPIKGYLQIVKILLYAVAGIIVLSLLMNRSPLVFLGGFGAMTAVLLLVFRDTILSLVASITLTQNDMIAVGDWIEMPKFGADGDVVDIALHTVKVQNWDKTITTIPTHQLMADSFKNWRGMSLSGGRRIKRSVHLDLNTVRFLSEEEIARLERFELLRDYIQEKREELKGYTAERELEAGGEVIPTPRGLTNVGTFRAYLFRYLRQHPAIHQGMTLIVRQLPPGPEGLPMEIYTFSRDTNWASYEGIQADIFDHILAMIPEFGLRVFQSPSGRDLGEIRDVVERTRPD
ncbi:mechanosensitive ion channel family protein [Gemmatimonadota bacterium]